MYLRVSAWRDVYIVGNLSPRWRWKRRGTTRQPLTVTAASDCRALSQWHKPNQCARGRPNARNSQVPFRTEEECLNIVYSSIVFQHSCRSFYAFCIVFSPLYCLSKIRHGISIICASPCRFTHSNTIKNTLFYNIYILYTAIVFGSHLFWRKDSRFVYKNFLATRLSTKHRRVDENIKTKL